MYIAASLALDILICFLEKSSSPLKYHPIAVGHVMTTIYNKWLRFIETANVLVQSSTRWVTFYCKKGERTSRDASE